MTRRDWIQVGVAYFSLETGKRRLVSQIAVGRTGEPLHGCGALADCVITYQDDDGAGMCSAADFDAWRGDSACRDWGAA